MSSPGRQQPPAWAAQYFGIPFVDLGRDRSGCDCWGLFRLVMKEQAGIDLPSHDEYEGTSDKEDGPVIEALIKQGLASDEWIRIERGQERAFDGLLYQVAGYPMHVGLILCPGRALHAVEGTGVAQLKYDLPSYRHVVIAFYRHKSLI